MNCAAVATFKYKAVSSTRFWTSATGLSNWNCQKNIQIYKQNKLEKLRKENNKAKHYGKFTHFIWPKIFESRSINICNIKCMHLVTTVTTVRKCKKVNWMTICKLQNLYYISLKIWASVRQCKKKFGVIELLILATKSGQIFHSTK